MSVDLDTALTLGTVAEQTSDARKSTRNEKIARRALDTVLHLYGELKLADDERKGCDRKNCRCTRSSETNRLGQRTAVTIRQFSCLAPAAG